MEAERKVKADAEAALHRATAELVQLSETSIADEMREKHRRRVLRE
jgi:hypothetical protein